LGVGKSALATGGWLGVLVVVVQNWVDLGLEVPGVAIAVVTVWGSLWGERKRRGARTPSGNTPLLRQPTKRWQLGPWAVGLPLTLVVLAACFGRHDVDRDREDIYARLPPRGTATASSIAGVRGLIRQAMLRHPADPYFPLVGASLAWSVKDQNPMPWLQRSLERAVLNSRAHLL